MKDILIKYQKLLLLVFVVRLDVTVLMVGIPGSVVAQPGLHQDPEQTPIDGGWGILAALGGAYGIKKLRKKKK